MRLRTIIFLFCVLGLSNAQNNNNGNCSIEGFVPSDWTVIFKPDTIVTDEAADEVIFSGAFTGKLDDLSCTPSATGKSNYVDFEAKDGKFTIKTAADIVKLDEETAQTSSPFYLNYVCTMNCDAGQSQLGIAVKIADYNNHKPEFSQATYTYTVASPIMPHTDFTLEGDVIKATDLDFSNNNIIFTVDPPHFVIDTTADSTDSNKKTFVAKIRAKSVVQLKETTTTYTLTATDVGTDPGPLSQTASLTFTIDADNSLDIPSFEYQDSQTDYSFQYQSDNTLKPLSGSIKLNTQHSLTTKNFELLGDMKGKFSIEYDSNAKEITLSVQEEIKDPTVTLTVLTLNINNGQVTVSTPVIIYFTTSSIFKFDKHIYTGSYDDAKNQVNLDESITITSSGKSDVNIEIAGDLAKYFSAVKGTDAGTWSIKVATPAPTADELKGYTYLNLVLTATEDDIDGKDTASLLVKLPSHVLQFSKILYEATYNEDNTVTMSDKITFTTNEDTVVDITVDTNYEKYFVVSQEDKSYIIKSTTTPLPDEILSKQTEIAVIITAKDGYQNTQQAVVKITLPEINNEKAPKFTKSYYKSEYKQNQTDNYLDFTDPLTFDNVDDPSKVKISLDAYSDNFEIVYDKSQKKWRVHIKDPLTSKDFDSWTEILVIMEATESGVTKTGKSVLVIDLTTDVGPQFVELYYSAEYKQNDTKYIDFHTALAFEKEVDPKNLQITLDTYTNNFAVTYDTAQKEWRIQIKSPLSSKDFESLSEIVLTMEATQSGVNKTGKAVLVIELITETGPEFSKLYYASEYKQYQKDYIDFKEDVTFTENIDPNNLKITIDSYTDNFAVVYDTAQTKWRIEIKLPLNSQDFESLSEIVLTMEATEIGVTKTGKSVLVIELTTDATEVGPQFNELFYQCEYKQGQIDYLDFGTDIGFTENIDPKNLKIILNSYTDNFAVTYDKDEKKWRIQITVPLDSNVFDSLSEIILTMEAIETGVTKSGKAMLVIELKTDAREVGPQFKDLYYQSEYKQGKTDYIDFKTDVAFEEDIDPKNIKISMDSYTDNFAIVYDTAQNKWRIQINSPLSSKDFESLSEIVLTMEATESGVTKTGKSVLIIELKTDATEVGPQFKDLYYEAEYKQGQTDYIDFKSPVAFKADNDPNNLKISIDSYTNNFAVTYDATNKKWRIQIKSPLTSKDFESLSEIVITMEATESGVTKTGKSVLVIELKTDATEVGPQFKDLYYEAEYKEGQTDYIDFKSAVAFREDNDPNNLKISIDSYTDNFAVTYDTTNKKWRIQLISPLDSKDFESLSEIVITMEATESGVTKTGKSVLVIELKTDATEVGPQFKDLYYQSEYKQGQTRYIDFKTPVAFERDIDPKNIKISMDSYMDNFEVTYDTAQQMWRIKIKSPLDSKDFESLSEIVLTMEATESGITKTGKSVLVIELKTDATEVGPQFKDLYYQSEYKQGQTDYLDFKTDVTFEADNDPKNIEITIDSYKDNFAITYDTTEKKWRIKIIDPLDSKVFDSLSEIVLTMEATETGVTKTGKSVLVIELKTDTTEVGPQFKELYYRSEYKQGQSDYIDFKTALDFEQDIDPKNIKISVDDAYKDNFAITYDTTEKKWRIQITDPLDSKIFDSLSEIVLTMEATETGITKTGKSVLVIELKTDTTEVGPQFKELYYQSEYKQGQTDYIDFKTALAFEQDIDPKNVKISVDDVYKDNFAVTYDTTEKKWRIQITDPLDSKVFDSLSEIILTMEATETGVTKTGRSVLVIELKTDTTEVGPQFKDLYYEAEYKKDQTDYIDFKTDVAFTETIDPKNLKIAINDYTANFDVEYDSDKWRIKITKPLDDSVFDTTTELILVMEASETGITSKGSSVLVIKLTGSSVNDKVPKFKDVYYSAEYPKEGSGTIPFDQEINFENIADISKVHIVVSDYTDYFSVAYDTTKTAWSITIVKPLDLNAVTGPVITTLSATIDGDDEHKPVAAFTLKLPELTAPIFSKPYYQAEYKVSGTTATVNLIDQIGFGADVDDTNIDITSNDYSEYFTFTYEEKQWKVVTNGILDLKELDRSDLVVSITATDKTTKLTSFSVIDLKLPNVNTEDAPKFSKTYYTASYTVSGDNKATVTLDEQFAFSNRDDPKSVTLTTDNYQKNFIIKFTDGKWTITVDQNLDADTLNSNDIVMSVIATDSTTKDVGECTLLMTLPKINSKDAPRFDKPYYQSECDDATTSLDAEIAITNKDDLSDINVSILEQDYKDNFNITFDDAAKVWKIAVLSVPKIKTSTNDLLLTLIATEKGNEELGQAALVLNFLAVTAPKFSSIQYRGSYKAAEVSSFEIGDIKITNKDKQDDIQLKLSLDSDSDISKYFKFTLTDNVWKVTLKDPLPDDDIKGKTELVLTLSATEKNNDEIGYATVIIALEDNVVTSDLTFSDVYYSADYIKSSPLPDIELDKDISLKSSEDLKDAVVEFVATDEFNANNYFGVNPTGTAGVYTISSKKELPDKILEAHSLSVVLQASLDQLPKAFATLVIDLPVDGESNSIDFKKALYEANYTISSDDERSFGTEGITIDTKEAAGNLKVLISPDSLYGAYFDVKQDNYEVIVTVKAKIPSDVYEKVSVIPLALEATSSGTQKVGKTVVNVNIEYNKGSVKFSSSLYNGNYTVKEGEATIYVDEIALATDQDADHISVDVDNDYHKYFKASYDKSKVTITKTADIPIADLKKISTISIQLKATVKNSKVEDNTVINLLIITDDTPTPEQGKISFDNTINTGEYSVVNGKGEFKEDKEIKLTTDRQNDEIEVKFSDDSEFKDKFSISYKDQVVTVEKKEDLSDDDFQSNAYISLEMIATITKSQQSSSAVLNIRMNNDGGNDNKHISFEYPAYKGLYNVSNNMADLDYEKITVTTDQTDENVEVKIAGPYNEYFDVLYTNKVVRISLKDTAASTTLRSLTNIPVVLYAQVKTTTRSATTVVNLQVRDYDNDNNPTESIQFPKLINDAQYIVSKGEFSSDDMVVVTNVLDEYIECDLSNDYHYEKYFQCNYKHTRVQVTLYRTLPKDEIKKLNNIALKVTISDKNRQGVYGDAILNIELKHQSETTDKEMNTTGYIVAISILSVLMFILLAGTAGFYFYKFRKSRYDKMTEDEYMNTKVRFDKSALKRPSNRDSTIRSGSIEERRPTGFIFNSTLAELGEEEPRDSSTDPDMKERKKSVAFDENVEKLQIDSVNDDDIDKALEEDKSEEASAKVE
ncbi:uncharacterized protein LOC114349448 isoform X37 [Diabrotica virgifera virgifera]|uniref:Cadherin domain-containing protein n=1 Tax=Diabrotica virgifera virgifera TaxID=50390 RepID=A0ABM5JWG5_DIAVI|nr:uncharacterized protein LOC114349448 isoform X37 [Diabrotica virgifera virgifera]